MIKLIGEMGVDVERLMKKLPTQMIITNVGNTLRYYQNKDDYNELKPKYYQYDNELFVEFIKRILKET